MRKKRAAYILISILILLLVSVIAYSYIYEYTRITESNLDFENRIDNTVMSSNIKIIVKTENETSENVTSYSYSSGMSGVIIKSDGNTYYAVTAYHVVDDPSADYFIELYNSEYISNSGISAYYHSLPQATIEYVDESLDLAIIKFETMEYLYPIKIADTSPKDSDIALISNANNLEEFHITYGHITTNSDIDFTYNEYTKIVFKHNAYSNNGSSGGAVINNRLELVGISLGGSKDLLGNFRHSLALPCNQINEFIENWLESSVE